MKYISGTAVLGKIEAQFMKNRGAVLGKIEALQTTDKNKIK
jgi:hypothetical protein